MGCLGHFMYALFRRAMLTKVAVALHFDIHTKHTLYMTAAVTQKFLVALIVINSILAGVSAEWAETRHEHWALFQMITILDNVGWCG